MSYDISPSLSDLLHSVWHSLGPSMLLQMALFHAFKWMSNILLYICTTSSLSILLLLLLSHFSRVRLCVTPEMAAHQALPSLGLSRQEHWSGLPLPSPMQESGKWKSSCSVVSASSRPPGLQPTRLLSPWDFPGKNTGVGCHRLLRSWCYLTRNHWDNVIDSLNVNSACLCLFECQL